MSKLVHLQVSKKSKRKLISFHVQDKRTLVVRSNCLDLASEIELIVRYNIEASQECL